MRKEALNGLIKDLCHHVDNKLTSILYQEGIIPENGRFWDNIADSFKNNENSLSCARRVILELLFINQKESNTKLSEHQRDFLNGKVIEQTDLDVNQKNVLTTRNFTSMDKIYCFIKLYGIKQFSEEFEGVDAYKDLERNLKIIFAQQKLKLS